MTADKPAELIERYLYAVAQELPRAQREDIIRELRTLIEDKLEAHTGAASLAPEAAQVANILRELGAPGTVARRYHAGVQHLVGPRLYPVLLRVLKIGLAALALALALAAVLSHATMPAAPGFKFPWSVFPTLLGHYVGAAVTFFGWTVLIFAVLERLRPERASAPERWDVQQLPPIPDVEENRVSVPGLAAETALVLGILAILNFAPQWVGVLTVSNGRTGFLPLADLGFVLPVAVIDVWLGFAVVLKIAVLAQRRWTRSTRWLEVAVGAMAAVVAYLIVTRSHLHAPPGVPQLDPAMQVLGRLFFIIPFAVAIQPVLRIVKLLRPARPAAGAVS